MTDSPDHSDHPGDVIRLASRGDGVTRNGRHVALAAPGDQVDDAGAVTPGPRHQVPPCRHFPRCGGCQMQHIDDTNYAVWLADRIAAALAQHHIAADQILPAHLSPPRTRRRAALKAQRHGNSVLIGFNQERSHAIVDMRQCEVLHPALFALVAPLRGLLAHLLPRKGNGSVQMTLADQGVDMLLGGVKAEGLVAHEALFDFAGAHSLARLAIDQGDGPEDRWVPEPVTITLGGVPVAMPHAPFLQATADGEAALVAAVLDIVGAADPVADLFAGLGTFALALAARRQVTAAEAGRDPLFSLQRAANLHHRAIACEHRDLYRRPLVPKELARFGAVVLDPPRAGAEEQAVELAASAVPLIAYVSCNPATFARDAAILVGGGYRIDWVKPVGQFRWSTHLELVSRLSKA